MDDSRVHWSDLPPELWTAIRKRLDSYIDVLRCRSVCRSWRGSVPPLKAVSPLLPLHVPTPPLTDRDLPIDGAVLIRAIIYRLSPLHQTSNSSSSSAEGWFAMVKAKKDGKMRFLRPLHESYLQFQYDALRKEVNLLDFRIQEVSTSYSLLSIDRHSYVPGVDKIVMFPDSPWIDSQDCTILAIRKNRKLGFVKLRPDHEWALIEEQDNNLHCDDVIAWRGQFYAIDKSGIVFRIDPESMMLKQICPPLCGSGDHKYLVECSSELYVVDRFDPIREEGKAVDFKAVSFKVYRVDLDEEHGRLLEVKNLGNEALVLGWNEASFSVSAADFEGIVEGNCIYYPRDSIGVLSSIIHVFNLQERIVESTNDKRIFKPPPILLHLDAPNPYKCALRHI